MTARFALLLFICAASAAAAADTPKARAARFYAAGLELPLLELRNGLMLVQACSDRLRRACDAEQRELGANNHALLLLDELTLFPQRPTRDPAAGISKARELREKISEASAAFLVTGNLRHFPVATFEDIQILEPARFAHVLAERLRL